MSEVVIDSCCLSNFAHSDSLYILDKLFGRSAYISEFVYAEILRGIQKGHNNLLKIIDSVKDGQLGEINLITSEEKALFETLSVSLGLGEASSIAIAKSRGFLLASDDRTARSHAQDLGISVTGTLGIIKKAVLNSLLAPEEGDLFVAHMKNAGFDTPINTLQELKIRS